MGKGYLSEALRRMVEAGFGDMALNRIKVIVHPDTAASLRLFERHGIVCEELLRGEFRRDGVCYDPWLLSLRGESVSPIARWAPVSDFDEGRQVELTPDERGALTKALGVPDRILSDRPARHSWAIVEWSIATTCRLAANERDYPDVQLGAISCSALDRRLEDLALR